MKSILICHDGDAFDQEGLSCWLASFSDLDGLVILREKTGQLRRRVQRELRRSGWLHFIDVLAFRLYYNLFMAARDREWTETALRTMRQRFGDLPEVPIVYSHSPNTPEVEQFLRDRKPDIVIARCKFILKERVFTIPTLGTFVMHPGICPEYRNAHGCFWALARRDRNKVGVTLLKIDSGIDTGPVYGYYSYDFDEKHESHMVISMRCVFENLEDIALKLKEIAAGTAIPLDTRGRPSNTWGQPWLTQYIRWKWIARTASL